MTRLLKLLRYAFAHEGIFLFLLLIFGFFYRLYFAGLAYQYPVFDMDRYVSLAREILRGNVIAECCDKTAGYPMFLASVFLIFGESNLDAVRVIQCIVELFTIISIFIVARILYGKQAGYFSSALYAVNPFTSSYTGLILPEILTLGLISMLLLILSRKTFPTRLGLWLLYGISLGLLIFVRKQFMTISLLATIYITLVVVNNVFSKIRFVLIVVAGFLVVSSYSLFANFRTYGKITVIPPYQYTGQVYQIFYQTKPYAELLLMGQQFEPIYFAMGEAWHDVPLYERDAVNKTYHDLFMQKLRTDWPLFIHNYTRSMVFIWDREHLFYYLDPWYPQDKWVVRLINLVYLGVGIGGLVFWIHSSQTMLFRNPVFALTLISIGMTTFFFTLLSSEVRHSLATFGMLCLLGGYGVKRFGLLLCTIK